MPPTVSVVVSTPALSLATITDAVLYAGTSRCCTWEAGTGCWLLLVKIISCTTRKLSTAKLAQISKAILENPHLVSLDCCTGVLLECITHRVREGLPPPLPPLSKARHPDKPKAGEEPVGAHCACIKELRNFETTRFLQKRKIFDPRSSTTTGEGADPPWGGRRPRRS